MPEMNLRQPGFTYSAVDLKKERKNPSLKKQEIHNIFIKMT